jgi:hypothetical protein
LGKELGCDRVQNGTRLNSRVRSLTSWLVLAAAVFSLVAAGCGKSSDTKANEAYADSVCTAIGMWEQQIKSVASDLTSGISKSTLQAKVTQAESATQTLVDQIKAVPPPDTEQGQAAKQQLDQLTSDITNAVDAGKKALTQIEGNASAATIAASVALIAPQVQGLVNESRSAISTLKSAGGSLASAFKSTDSCKSLG